MRRLILETTAMVKAKKPQASFADKVWKVVCAIPKGQVLSYGAVAKKAGFPGAARAVGTLMKHNFDPARPCHRVICADGSLGQYNRGVAAKERILRKEGVPIKQGKVMA